MRTFTIRIILQILLPLVFGANVPQHSATTEPTILESLQVESIILADQIEKLQSEAATTPDRQEIIVDLINRLNKLQLEIAAIKTIESFITDYHQIAPINSSSNDDITLQKTDEALNSTNFTFSNSQQYAQEMSDYSRDPYFQLQPLYQRPSSEIPQMINSFSTNANSNISEAELINRIAATLNASSQDESRETSQHATCIYKEHDLMQDLLQQRNHLDKLIQKLQSSMANRT